jgi:lipoyl(octanoyl) transferase
MNLHLLPTRTGGAAENMALDFLLLQRYPEPAAPRFRHYDWRSAAFTFGFGQKIAFVRARLPADEHVELCRRPTGGGIVDHRHDWTYALVLPRGHALHEARATQSYRAVHECVATALVAAGVPAVLKAVPDPGADAVPAGPGVCFQHAELFDVVHGTTGAKLAGAAQKRNKHGLLMQGSIDKAATGAVDWDKFQARFTAALAGAVGAAAAETPWPDLNEDEVSGLTEQYATPEWIEYR